MSSLLVLKYISLTKLEHIHVSEREAEKCFVCENIKDEKKYCRKTFYPWLETFTFQLFFSDVGPE
jgi:hypothetical protein